jgi:hypothetical protein
MTERNLIVCAASWRHKLRIGNRKFKMASQAGVAHAVTAFEPGRFARRYVAQARHTFDSVNQPFVSPLVSCCRIKTVMHCTHSLTGLSLSLFLDGDLYPTPEALPNSPPSTLECLLDDEARALLRADDSDLERRGPASTRTVFTRRAGLKHHQIILVTKTPQPGRVSRDFGTHRLDVTGGRDSGTALETRDR